jgi:hypothetical protein
MPSDQKPVALLPCPKCKGTDTNFGEMNADNNRHYISCEDCDWQTATFETRAEAIALWNTRTPPASEPVPEVAAVVADLLRLAPIQLAIAQNVHAIRLKLDPSFGGPEPEFSEGEIVMRQAAALLSAQAVMLEEARGAIERLHRNFNLLLRGAPVRDVAETDAEVKAVLAKMEAHRP